MLTNQKKVAVLSTAIAALIAGACLSARPASALPMTLSMSHLTRPVYDHDKDTRQDHWQGRNNQGNNNQWRGNHDGGNYRRDQDNRRRADWDTQQRDRDDKHKHHDNRKHDRDDNQNRSNYQDRDDRR